MNGRSTLRSSPAAEGGPRYAGRLGAKLFLAAGLLTILNNNIPPYDHLDRPLLYGVGLSAIVWGVVSWVVPWDRLPKATTLVLGPIALAHIAVANHLGGVSPYSYGVYFVVVFVYVGMSQPPRTSIVLAPLALAAYVGPPLLDPETPPIAALSASVAIPVCVLVGEVVSRAIASQRLAQAASQRRADASALLGRFGRAMNTLDPDEVLELVVSGAIRLGFDAAEIALFDEDAGVHRMVCGEGLPEGYGALGGMAPIDQGIAGRVRREGSAVMVDDYSGSEVAVDELRDAGFHAALSMPIRCQGTLTATLTAGRKGPEPIDAEDVEAIELLAAQAGRALENARRFEAEQGAVRRLAQLERLKDDFLSNISHELRTPLTVISGMGRTLAQGWDRLPDRTRRDLLDRLNRNADTLEDIVTTLLDFSRMQGGQFDLRIQEVEVAHLCASVAGRIRSLLGAHRFSIDAPRPAVAAADPVLLERVVENLVTNAARHTPAGTRVELAVAVRDSDVTVTVTDDGPGIPEHDLAELGHRFFRGGDPDTRSQRGAGLGLAFSREILRLHAASLDITSKVGEGSRFAFTLPLAPGIEISSPASSADAGVVGAPD